jgi:signal transduction histidine kinase
MIKSFFTVLGSWLRGLSGKLIALFLVIAVLFVLTVGASLSHFYKDYFKNKVRPHVTRYLEYVREDIGLPADYAQAALLADKLNMTIMIVDSRGQWSSDSSVPRINLSDIDNKFRRKGIRYGQIEIEDKDYAAMTLSGTTLLFDLERFKHERKNPRIFAPLLFLLIILSILYYATRKLFSPILTIQEGVRKIGGGDLDHRIDIKRRDELGVLATDINAMADELQKMLDAKRQLLLAVSHELRSPLTRANVAIEMLDDSVLKQQIKQDVQEVGDLVSEILEIERLSQHHQALDKAEQDIVVLCNELVNNFRVDQPQEAAALRYELPAESILLYFDKTRIKLLLKNIVSNAMRYKTERVCLSVYTADDSVVLQISDDGDGIEEDLIPHLTEPFYRVDPARQRQTGGYGLGLYLCQVIAHAHGGRLDIQSQLGEGTCVRVFLPLNAR